MTLYMHVFFRMATSRPASARLFPLPIRSKPSLCFDADIADISHFVHPDNPTNSEASSQGTTVYLVDKRIELSASDSPNLS